MSDLSKWVYALASLCNNVNFLAINLNYSFQEFVDTYDYIAMIHDIATSQNVAIYLVHI